MCYLRNTSFQNYCYTFRKGSYTEGKERTMTEVCEKNIKSKLKMGGTKAADVYTKFFYFF